MIYCSSYEYVWKASQLWILWVTETRRPSDPSSTGSGARQKLAVWEIGTMEKCGFVVHLKRQQDKADKGTFSFTAALVTEHLEEDIWSSFSWKTFRLMESFFVIVGCNLTIVFDSWQIIILCKIDQCIKST